jgi:splicing factor 45
VSHLLFCFVFRIEAHHVQAIARTFVVDNINELSLQKQSDIPSQVILLTNMVGPGEVDDILQEETAEECSKYGKVERCLIFEVPKGKISDDRAVRIFVQFSSIESARKAIQDLNGRFFGGRIVSATFFDINRFERLDLAPSKEELYK